MISFSYKRFSVIVFIRVWQRSIYTSNFAIHFCLAFCETDAFFRGPGKIINFKKRNAKMCCKIGHVNGPSLNSDLCLNGKN